MKTGSLNYIDLFAGAGGLSEGFMQSGFEPVAHVEMNEYAAKTIQTRMMYFYLKEHGKLEHYYKYERGEIKREELQLRNLWQMLFIIKDMMNENLLKYEYYQIE